jgi:hypothetical protein
LAIYDVWPFLAIHCLFDVINVDFIKWLKKSTISSVEIMKVVIIGFVYFES